MVRFIKVKAKPFRGFCKATDNLNNKFSFATRWFHYRHTRQVSVGCISNQIKHVVHNTRFSEYITMLSAIAA